MRENKKKTQRSSYEKDQRLALLALQTSEKSRGSACLNDHDMALLIETGIDDPQYADLYQHINQCEDCYQMWKSLSELKNERFSTKIFTTLSKARSLTAMGSALAAAAVILIVFKLPPQEQIHKEIARPQSDQIHIEVKKQKLEQDQVLHLDEEASFRAPSELAAPAPITEAPSISRSEDLGGTALPQNRSVTMTAKTAPAIDNLKREILHFCKQPTFDDKKQLQLIGLVATLLEQEPENENLLMIHEILSEITLSNRENLCIKMEPVLKK